MKFNAYAFNDDGVPIGRIKDVPLGNVCEFLELHASDKYDSEDEVARFKVEPVEETDPLFSVEASEGASSSAEDIDKYLYG